VIGYDCHQSFPPDAAHNKEQEEQEEQHGPYSEADDEEWREQEQE
jgi:hypothetical protein